MDLIGTGLYPLKQAAKLVGANPRSVQRWMLGYKRKHLGQSTSSGPLWRTQYESDDLPDHAIGFLDLMELRMVAAFVRHGVSLQVIKATADAARISFACHQGTVEDLARGKGCSASFRPFSEERARP